jgi:hypothetical protein
MLQELFLSKTNLTLTRNNVQDAAASNIYGFFWRDTSISSTQLTKSFWNKMNLSPP